MWTNGVVSKSRAALAAVCLCVGGCGSFAVLEGVGPEIVAEATGVTSDAGATTASDAWTALGVSFEQRMAGRRIAADRVRVEVSWYSNAGLTSLSRKRRPGLERVTLGGIVEAALRKGGRLVSARGLGIRNIRPVDVHVGEHHADVILTGVTRDEALAALRVGLSEIGYARRRWGAIVKDVEDGLAFHFPPQHTMGYTISRYKVTVRREARGLRLRLSSWLTGPPPKQISGKRLRDLARTLGIQVLMKTSPP